MQKCNVKRKLVVRMRVKRNTKSSPEEVTKTSKSTNFKFGNQKDVKPEAASKGHQLHFFY